MINSQSRYLRSFLIFVVVFLSSVVYVVAQGQSERVLLVASCATEKGCGDVSIHRFAFRGGSLVSQEVLKNFVTDKGYFQGGENRIVRNRYAVSSTGAVLDIQAKEIYDDKVGAFIGVDENDLFIDEISLVNLSAGSTYRFDLETKKYYRHSRPNFYPLFGRPNGTISPDGKKAIHFDGITSGLFVMTKKGRRPSDFATFRAATGYTATCSKCASNIIFTVPAAWIDNDRFITQRRNGDLVVFDCTTRKWTDVVKIPHADVSSPPDLFSDPAGGIYYDADKLYKIDVANKRYIETDDYGLGHGFIVSGRRDTKLFSFEDRKLASFISGKYVATNGYLAVEYQEQPLTSSPPIGIRDWGEDVGSWTTIKIKYSPRIIGWLAE